MADNRMSENARRQKIEAMLAEDPGDTFLRYGLALELEKDGEHERSLQLLAELTQEQPPYVPAFFRSARQLIGLGQVGEARTFLRDGIEQARRQSDTHAATEMAELLATLGAAGE